MIEDKKREGKTTEDKKIEENNKSLLKLIGEREEIDATMKNKMVQRLTKLLLFKLFYKNIHE